MAELPIEKSHELRKALNTLSFLLWDITTKDNVLDRVLYGKLTLEESDDASLKESIQGILDRADAWELSAIGSAMHTVLEICKRENVTHPYGIQIEDFLEIILTKIRDRDDSPAKEG